MKNIINLNNIIGLNGPKMSRHGPSARHWPGRANSSAKSRPHSLEISQPLHCRPQAWKNLIDKASLGSGEVFSRSSGGWGMKPHRSTSSRKLIIWWCRSKNKRKNWILVTALEGTRRPPWKKKSGKGCKIYWDLVWKTTIFSNRGKK